MASSTWPTKTSRAKAVFGESSGGGASESLKLPMVIVSVAVPTSDIPSLLKAGVDARVDTDSRLSRDMRSCSRRFARRRRACRAAL